MFNKRRNNRNLGRGDFAKRRPLRRSMSRNFARKPKKSELEEKTDYLWGLFGFSGDSEELVAFLDDIRFNNGGNGRVYGGGFITRDMQDLAEELSDVISHLIGEENGSNDEIRNKEGWTYHAPEDLDVEKRGNELKRLIDISKDLCTEEGITKAFQDNDIDKIQMLIDGHINLNKVLLPYEYESEASEDDYGDYMTPFLYAVESATPDVVKFFLDKCGADVNVENASGYGALEVAIYRDRTDLIPILLEAGASPDGTYPPAAETPLTLAVRRGNLQAVKLLIDAGADPEQEDNNGDTPMKLATNEGHTKIASYLRKVITEQGRSRGSRRPSHRRR